MIITLNSCRDTSACISLDPMGVKNYRNDIFELYPNPNNGKFILVLIERGDLEITDALGRTIKKCLINAGNSTIDLEDVSNGIYSVKIICGTQQFIKQIVVNKID